MAQLVGTITDAPGPVTLRGEEPIRTDAAGWSRILADLARESGFDTFVYWPESEDETQLRRWISEVVPATGTCVPESPGPRTGYAGCPLRPAAAWHGVGRRNSA